MKTRLALAALAGLIVGGVATGCFVARINAANFANWYVASVEDQANVALHIRAGRQMELVARIEAALPSYVVAADRQFKGHPGITDALWMVRAYYERNRIAIPAGIQSILSSLPPKPSTSCEIRLQALDREAPTRATGLGENTE